MKCPKCEKENANNINACEFCGCEMFEAIDAQPVENKEEAPKKKSKKKLVIAIVATLVVIAIVGASVLVLAESRLNDNTTATKSEEQIEAEKYQAAKDAVVLKIKSNLKNPESLQIHNTYYKNTPPSAEDAEKYDVSTEYAYVFRIDYSAENGFGGMNRSEAIGLYHKDGSVSVAFKEQSTSYMNYLIIYSTYSYVE